MLILFSFSFPHSLPSLISPALTLWILNQVRHSSFSQLHWHWAACIFNKHCCMCFFFSFTYPHFLSQLRWKWVLWICMTSPSFLYWSSLSLLLPIFRPVSRFLSLPLSPSLTFDTGSLTLSHESTSWVIFTKNIQCEDESLYDIVQKYRRTD